MVANIPASLLEAHNIVLVIILIALFIIGYKLMRAVMDLFLVAIFSGLFLIGLGYIGIGPELTITRFILFMAIGVASYMIYSTLTAAKDVVTFLRSIVHTIIDLLYSISQTIYDGVSSLVDTASSTVDKQSSSKKSDETGSKEKIAILKEDDDD